MNSTVTKIKPILESFYDHAIKSTEECRQINERYKPDTAEPMCKTVKESLYAIYLDDKQKIETLTNTAIEAVLAADVFRGEDITADAELLKDERFDIGHRQFEFLVNRYAYKNNTMIALLRGYYLKQGNSLRVIAPELQAALAPVEERVRAWEKIRSSAVSLLDTVYTQHSAVDGHVHPMQEKHEMPVTRDQVECFMAGTLSKQLHLLIGE